MHRIVSDEKDTDSTSESYTSDTSGGEEAESMQSEDGIKNSDDDDNKEHPSPFREDQVSLSKFSSRGASEP